MLSSEFIDHLARKGALRHEPAGEAHKVFLDPSTGAVVRIVGEDE